MRSPFGVAVSTNLYSGVPVLRVDFTLPADCVLYADRLHFQTADGTNVAPVNIPDPAVLVDKVTGHQRRLYNHDFSVMLEPVKGVLLVKFQGCTNAACFFPEKRAFAMNAAGRYGETAVTATDPSSGSNVPVASVSNWKNLVNDFQVKGRQTGYVKASEFVSFLNGAASGKAPATSDPLAKFKQFGLAATLCLIVLGGLGLNLTPCVLPLIPINLAIIGAGKSAQSRGQGFRQGAAYGLGMSLAYGALGLFVVLTGAKFGTLNSSIWFNVAIALIFLVLALAMFDLFHIDFSNFERLFGRRNPGPSKSARGNWVVAFSLGAVAALLAGACVAPVVISVLLMATDLHAKGAAIGLALPFLLGLGMALPWPFMGASLSFLPKPGKWMAWVKYTFGVAIILFALYYGNIAYGLFVSARSQTNLASAPNGATQVADGDQTLTKALVESHQTGRPIFVDFAASWCKNCEAMDYTVFNQSNVQQRLKDFIVVRYPAERPNESPARDVLNHFSVMGLPTYLVLSAK